jgi:GNAT acetyltransferase-like protein
VIVYRKNGIARGEIWFDTSVSPVGVDVAEYYHVAESVAGCRCVDFYTILFDLGKSEDELFAAVRPEARRQIRKSDGSGELAYDHWFPADDASLDRFFAAYDELAAQKGLAALDRELTRAYAAAGHLDISLVRKTDGAPLAWHAYFRTPARIRQLHSIAFFREDKAERNLIGRAHRWQTWEDIKRAKASGIATFDLGGWYHGKSDQELLKVNAFKEEFGGVVVRHQICERAVTLKGKAYLFLRNLAGAGIFNAVAKSAPPVQEAAGA